MGSSEEKTTKRNSKECEEYTGHKQIPMKIANKVVRSVCKITIKTIKGI